MGHLSANILLPLLLLIILLPESTQATWLFTKHNICNPSQQQQQQQPFTGFKIIRQYKISGYNPPVSMHFLTIAHCNAGKVDYKKVLRTQSNKFIDWDVPFCLLKPSVSEAVVGVVDEVPKQGENNGHSSFENEYMNVSSRGGQQQNLQTAKVPSSRVLNTIKRKSIQINDLIRKKFDTTMEKLTNGKWIEYSGKSNNAFSNKQQAPLSTDQYNKLDGFSTHIQQQSALSPLHTALTQELNNLICFKMARRKRYAKRKVSFFMPHTFVGAIYECLIPLDQKHEILKSLINSNKEGLEQNHSSGSLLPLSNHQFFMVMQNFPMKCDSHLSRPLAPLFAEDSTKQWFENKFHHLLNPKFIQTIPYLSTPAPPAATSSLKAASAALALLQQPLQLLSTPFKLLGFPLPQQPAPQLNTAIRPFSSSFSSFSFANTGDTTWADKINVNEDYNYNEIDLHLISKTVAYSANILNKLIAPLDFNWLVKGYNRANVNERDAAFTLDNEPVGQDSGGDGESHQLLSSDGYSWDQKVSYWLASLNEKYINRILLQIESSWDRLNID
ncbi:hypothetical protein I9W82_000479 [Candida metapsilosis]|uniref:Uncharacterized protein n=1 Tax=Candida metapsilosis TaxID=273372 RepID=A0A8H7ZIS7_9ASCO|nr:hypothetical protein I9W82_000479 [Candida metapsilosis]